MSRTRAVLGTAITGAATALAVLGGAGAAHAADALVYSTDGNGVVHGSMKHHDDGDKFYVTDLEADGHGVRGFLLDWEGDVIATRYNGNGNQTSVTFGYDIRSNYRYTMLICTVDGSGDTTGSYCGSKNIME